MGPAVPPDDGNDAGPSGFARDWPGRELLQGRSPREVLAKLCDGDPLELGPRVDEWLRNEAVLVDPNRAAARTAARVAHAAMRYRGSPELGVFLTQVIERSVEELLEEEGEDELARVPVGDVPGAHLLLLWNVLGIELPLARRASIVCNREPREVRRAFVTIAGGEATVREYAARNGTTEEHVRGLLSRALRAMAAAVGRPSLCVEGWDDHG